MQQDLARPTWRAWALTALLAGFVLASGFVTGSSPGRPEVRVPEPLIVGVLAVGAAALFVRYRRPEIALSIAAAAASVSGVVGGVTVGSAVATMVCLYQLASRRSRRTAVMGAVATAVVVAMPALLVRTDAWADGTLVQTLLSTGFATALGVARRLQLEQIEDFADRAQRAEQSKEAEARRQVTEERLRIARDLHDAVAHQIAVINLHAGAARQTLTTRPSDADASLQVIGDAAREVLSEISGLLGWLRQEEQHPGITDLGIEQTAGSIPDLITAARDRGLELDYVVRGRARRLNPQVDVVAYRVVKEALTNAYKHSATAAATLSVTWLHDEVVLDCRNPLSGLTEDVQTSSGHGLQGMRELVEGVGGKVSAKPGEGQFRLVVSLPAVADTAGVAR